MRWENYNQTRGRRENYNRSQNQGGERGWWDKAGDEVSSWFGDEEAWRRRQMDERADGNYNEYDQNSYHSYQAGYTPKEANPFYPTTNRIYEREGGRRESRTSQQQNFSSGFAGSQRNQNRWRDWHDTRAGDLMTADVATVHPNDTAQYAARIMRDEDCGALPVVDRNGRMIGMVTDRDITIRLVASGADPRFAQVQDCMTDEVFACHVNDPIESCMRAMRQHQIRRIAVVNSQNQVVGIISQGDLARHADMNRQKGERTTFTDMVANVSEPSSGAYR